MNKGIELKGVTRVFDGRKVLNGITLSFPSSGMVGILGPSGCGKSTLLNILAGLDDGYAGQAQVMGKEWRGLSERKRRRFRLRHIGYVFQNFNLLELETAEINVMLPMDAHFRESAKAKKHKATDLLRFLSLRRKAKQRINTLSGGEKARVALCRALANDPEILLCDEPSGALDEANAHRVFELLRRCAKQRLVIVVSHDKAMVEQYCSRIVTLRDGVVLSDRSQTASSSGLAPKSFRLRGAKSRPRLSRFFFLSHAFHVIRAKKWRSLFCQSAIAMGLSGLGVSQYISSSISDELNHAFSAIVPPSAIVMSPRSSSNSPIGSIYGATFEDCRYALDEYGDLVWDYGSDLHMDYESWFVDRNDFTFMSGVETVRLKGFSIRHINDFAWFDVTPGLVCYPRPPATLRDDEVVLGLPYEQMFTTCLSLHISRDYQSLGEYIDAKGMELVLHAANYAYGFDDEELFSVFAVVESPVPCFYHLDHQWNRKVFVEQMRFRTSLSEEVPNPQYIFEIPYLTLRSSISDFLAFARRDPRLEHLLYEKESAAYAPSLFQNGYVPDLRRLYLYAADKCGTSFVTLDEAMAFSSDIVGREPITARSYYAQAGSLAMGFAGKFFLCATQEAAEMAIDFYSDLPLDGAFLAAEEIPGTLDGSLLGAATGGVRVSCDFSSVAAMDLPVGPQECFLSSSLFESWGRPSYVYVSAEIGAEEVGNRYVRDMAMGAIKVKGTIDAPYPTLFVRDDWTVDFYLECLGASSFVLEPMGAVLYVSSSADIDGLITALGRAFPAYAFSSPALEVAASIASTLGYVGTMLGAFSLIALAMSALLFLIVMAITIHENAKEARLFVVLGISSSDIARCYSSFALLYAGMSLLSGLGMVGLSILVAKLYVASSFHAPISWEVPYLPFAVVGIATLAFTAAIILGVRFTLWRKKDSL